MVFDELVEVTGGWLAKGISVGKLRKLLSELPGDFDVMPNRVGNLSIINVAGEQVGYLDIGEEMVTLFGEEDA